MWMDSIVHYLIGFGFGFLSNYVINIKYKNQLTLTITSLKFIAEGKSGCDDEGLVRDKKAFPECSDVAKETLKKLGVK